MRAIDDQLLAKIQSGFPLEEHPYTVLGERLGLSEEEIYRRIAELELNGTIRRIGASFASAKLGYRSSLCAISVENDFIEDVVATINASPNVTHDYGRAHAYNVWFTLIAPSQQALEEIFQKLVNQPGITSSLFLPATKLFKIKVDFSEMEKGSTAGSSGQNQRATKDLSRTKQLDCSAFDPTSSFDVELVRIFQEDIVPIGIAPYEIAAQEISQRLNNSVSQSEILNRLKELKANGTIRRFGAMVHHHKIGFTANVMTTWVIPEDKIRQVGEAFAASSHVSHCYERCHSEDWPFNLYAMVHGKDTSTTDDVILELAEAARSITGQPSTYQLLPTLKEYKKTSMKYFLEAN